jgi:membrane-associated phospholipid phosphatase
MHQARKIVFLVLLAVALAGRAGAESPYRRGWPKDSWIAGGSAAAYLAAILVNREAEPLTEREIAGLSRESVNPFDRSATWNYSEAAADASDVVLAAVVAAPAALLLDDRVREDWGTCALMYAETMAIAVVLSAITKTAVDRIRPFVYNENAPMDEKTTIDAEKSFFSRHATLAFASAVFLSTVYGDYHPGSAAGPYLWGGSLLAAAGIGFMRYESGKHFPTDVITGAVVGCAAGYIIPRIHRVSGDRLSLHPDFTGCRPGLALELKL